MEKGVAKILATICQNACEEYPAGKGLEAFCEEYGVGYRDGKSFRFYATAREKIKRILLASNYDWRSDISTFNQLSRAEVSRLSNNEKDTSRPVREGKVAIKSLPGRPLLLTTGPITLPPGTNLDVGFEWVAANIRHDSVLVIENWECFERAHDVELLGEIPGNPLVVFRGDPTVYKVGFTHALLEQLQKPVAAFVDYDPAGIVIAQGLPCFESFVAPSDEVLELLLEGGNGERFAEQYSSNTVKVLDTLEHEQLRHAWQLINKHGKALPQEKMISLC
ncbi:DUF7281 domain-containing protein [Pseudomonas serbica]|jgi:hypothetical protein|uniref:DUF7281 domain-containing protein n=1 Tax=Pseudomonas serbica TaxID=2965074 RepID=UPI00237B2DB8|nr:hypothetical protein [Pseudomonas serbica]